MDFAKQFAERQEMARRTKLHYEIKRVMEIERRAKIKPSAMNPVLLTKSIRLW